MTRFIHGDDDDFDGALEWQHEPRAGNDTTPLFSTVRDPHYSRGGLTSQPRTMSPAYIKFLERHKEQSKHGRSEAG